MRADSTFAWIGYYDAMGKRKLQSTKQTDMKVAQRILDVIERKIAAGKESGLIEDDGIMTFGKFSKRWLELRRARGIQSALIDDAGRLAYVTDKLGSMPLDEIRPKHIKEVIRELETTNTRRYKQGAKKLAPRTVRRIYSALRTLFADALDDELIETTPCVLMQRRGQLPKSTDRDPYWRQTAIFARHEVEALITDPRIPMARRVRYAMMFLTGARIGELTPRRWRDLDMGTPILGRLTINSHWDLHTKTLKPGTKVGPTTVRYVPVHPALGTILGAWRDRYYEQHTGRAPTPDALILPTVDGEIVNARRALQVFHLDLKRLGFRARRQHDARRTFISMTLADGATKEWLRWVTHGTREDVFDEYIEANWHRLCEAVGFLRILSTIDRLAA